MVGAQNDNQFDVVQIGCGSLPQRRICRVTALVVDVRAYHADKGAGLRDVARNVDAAEISVQRPLKFLGPRRVHPSRVRRRTKLSRTIGVQSFDDRGHERPVLDQQRSVKLHHYVSYVGLCQSDAGSEGKSGSNLADSALAVHERDSLGDVFGHHDGCFRHAERVVQIQTRLSLVLNPMRLNGAELRALG